MKHTVLFILLLVGYYSHSQNDTIDVAKNYQTLLFFDSPIIYSPIGNAMDFVQTVGEKSSKYSERIIKLSQNIGSKSSQIFTNLNVITEDGNSYDFILRTVKTPRKNSIKIDKSSASFNLEYSEKKEIKSDNQQVNKELTVISSKKHQYSLNSPKTIQIKETKQTKIKEPDYNKIDNLYSTNRNEYFRLRCYYSQFNKAKIPRYFARNNNVILWLKNIYYDRDYLFVQFKFENKQSIDFDINFINYMIATDYGKSGSNQETVLEPEFIYKQPSKVKGKTENHFVVVFSKFSLEKNMVFRVDIKEKNGARTLLFDIDKDLINNPKPFNK